MLRWFVCWMAAAAAAAWCETVIPDVGGTRPVIVIRVHERVDLPPILLLQAEDYASRIFAAAGLDVRFESARCGRPKPNAAETGAAGVRYIDAEIRNVPDGYYRGALGLARPFASQGMQVEVFYPRVAQVIERRPVFAGKIFGHVIAHEIGHVLTRIPVHSAEGIMKARFDNADFMRMAQGFMLFDARDLAAMQATVLDWARHREPPAEHATADGAS